MHHLQAGLTHAISQFGHWQGLRKQHDAAGRQAGHQRLQQGCRTRSPCIMAIDQNQPGLQPQRGLQQACQRTFQLLPEHQQGMPLGIGCHRHMAERPVRRLNIIQAPQMRRNRIMGQRRHGQREAQRLHHSPVRPAFDVYPDNLIRQQQPLRHDCHLLPGHGGIYRLQLLAAP